MKEKIKKIISKLQSGMVTNIEEVTNNNNNFRKVLFTTENLQLVVMSLNPQEDIGLEKHDVDQFFRIESGEGKLLVNGFESAIRDGFAFIIKAGEEHNVINTGETCLKLYTIYSPPHHKPDTIQEAKP